ncbi:hypothetical protein [Nostocoides vanveenii]|uniref:Lon N-terminal domain-containing protein n=1 Tax=Nostocoides vanveenii TaxID=330835 RepID=A0ABP4WD56_9MICO
MPALPIFPLGTIAVPGFVIGLQIFEPRYLQLLSDLGDLPEADRLFGVSPSAAGTRWAPATPPRRMPWAPLSASARWRSTAGSSGCSRWGCAASAW